MDVIKKGGSQTGGLKEDSMKKMGMDPGLHIPRTHGATKTDHKRVKEGSVDKAKLGSNKASNTSFPFAKSYGKPSER